MLCKFPYFEDRPHIPIVIEYKSKRARFLPLLDTGADFSIFNKSDAMRLGLEWKDGVSTKLCNADGSCFNVKSFELMVEIEGYKFKATICFTDNKKSSMPLLGRSEIFEKFKITILEKEKTVELESI